MLIHLSLCMMETTMILMTGMTAMVMVRTSLYGVWRVILSYHSPNQ